MNLVCRWRIIEMDLWDREAIELVGPGYLEFREDGMASFGLIAVKGWLDCRPVQTDSPTRRRVHLGRGRPRQRSRYCNSSGRWIPTRPHLFPSAR